MAAIFKVQHLFDTGIRPDGWSETWYVNADDQKSAQDQGKTIAQARVQLLATKYVLHYQRVTSNIPTIPAPAQRRVRKASLENMSLTAKPGGGTTATPDLPWMAALIRVQNSDRTVFRNFLMRGLPDELWSNGNDDQARAFFSTFLGGFAKQLKAAAAVILHKQDVPPPLSPLPIIYCDYERMVKRATGRPFGLDRGRR